MVNFVVENANDSYRSMWYLFIYFEFKDRLGVRVFGHFVMVIFMLR